MVQRYNMRLETKIAPYSNVTGEWVRFEDYDKLRGSVKRALHILSDESDIFVAVAKAEDELSASIGEAGEEA